MAEFDPEPRSADPVLLVLPPCLLGLSTGLGIARQGEDRGKDTPRPIQMDGLAVMTLQCALESGDRGRSSPKE